MAFCASDGAFVAAQECPEVAVSGRKGQGCSGGADGRGAGKGVEMALKYKTRRRLALLVLCVGLPAYIVVAVTLVGLIDRPSVLAELAVYLGLGFLWIVPLRPIFLGVGQPDPDAEQAEGPRPPA